MSERCEAIALRARALVGVPFRFQGRDREIGLDCVGLAALVYGIPPSDIRRDYSRRTTSINEARGFLAARFRPIAHGGRCGDLMLCAVRSNHLHFAIHCGESFVHADARLRRVAEVPGSLPWPLIGVFRAVPTEKK